MTRSFAKLYQKRMQTPEYHSQELAVSFLADLTEAMRAKEITNSELARRAGVSPAYITKVFRGPSNLSMDTIAKLAMATGTRASLRLASRGYNVIWQDLISADRRPDRRYWPSLVDDAVSAMGCLMPPVDQGTSNDEKFAFAA